MHRELIPRGLLEGTSFPVKIFALFGVLLLSSGLAPNKTRLLFAGTSCIFLAMAWYFGERAHLGSVGYHGEQSEQMWDKPKAAMALTFSLLCLLFGWLAWSYQASQ